MYFVRIFKKILFPNSTIKLQNKNSILFKTNIVILNTIFNFFLLQIVLLSSALLH